MLVSKDKQPRAARTKRREWRELKVTKRLVKQIESRRQPKPGPQRQSPVHTALPDPGMIAVKEWGDMMIAWGNAMAEANAAKIYVERELPLARIENDVRDATKRTTYVQIDDETGLADVVLVPDSVLDRDNSVIVHQELECLECQRHYFITATGRTQNDCLIQIDERCNESCPTCLDGSATDQLMRDHVRHRREQSERDAVEKLVAEGKGAEAWRLAFRLKMGYDLK